MRSGLRPWLADVREVLSEDTRQGLLLAAYYAYVGANLTVTSRYPIGTPIFDRDWDALVVLDACRVDALRAVADEFAFIDTVDTVRSVGSTSAEWMAQSFHRRYRTEIAQTAMVTANVHSNTVLRDRDFPPQYVGAPVTWPAWDPVDPGALHDLVEVWRDGWDDATGTVLPRTVTDSVIERGRRGGHERLVAHYLQPHAPYVQRGDDGVISSSLAEPLEKLRTGAVSRETAWERYLDTLRLVLEDVGLVLENLDADRVVITADHGEAFGETGFYEHPVCCPHPVVKRVPWVETTATDRQTHEPTQHVSSGGVGDPESGELAEQLAALGYT